MHLRQFIGLGMVLATWLVTAAELKVPGQFKKNQAAIDAVERPNVVFFLVDDMGWTDLGCYGSDFYETPHVDRLAKEGMKFTDAYAASCVCSPTRVSILTGKYPGRVHITHAIPIQGAERIKEPLPLIEAIYEKNLPLEEFTIADTKAWP